MGGRNWLVVAAGLVEEGLSIGILAIVVIVGFACFLIGLGVGMML